MSNQTTEASEAVTSEALPTFTPLEEALQGQIFALERIGLCYHRAYRSTSQPITGITYHGTIQKLTGPLHLFLGVCQYSDLQLQVLEMLTELNKADQGEPDAFMERLEAFFQAFKPILNESENRAKTEASIAKAGQ